MSRLAARNDPPGEPPDLLALPPGARVLEFEIERVVGRGGFSIVYLAFDHSLHRRVALKEYLPQTLARRDDTLTVVPFSAKHRETFDIGLRSFLEEARLLARFEHPALVKVYRFWAANGTAYMAMAYYDGPTLREAFLGGVHPTSKTVEALTARLLDAVELLHRGECLHRDIAPDNVILQRNGNPVLLDFGAARRIIKERTQALTVILKTGYAPIEQYSEEGEMTQGPWTDVYSLAATLYAVITGKGPPASVSRAYNDPYVPLARVAPAGYAPEFAEGIDRGLAFLPHNRLQSIAALRESLGLVGRDSSTPARESAARTARKPLPSDADAPTVRAPPPVVARAPAQPVTSDADAPTVRAPPPVVARTPAKPMPSDADAPTVRAPPPVVAQTPAKPVPSDADAPIARAPPPIVARTPAKPVPWDANAPTVRAPPPVERTPAKPVPSDADALTVGAPPPLPAKRLRTRVTPSHIAIAAAMLILVLSAALYVFLRDSTTAPARTEVAANAAPVAPAPTASPSLQPKFPSSPPSPVPPQANAPPASAPPPAVRERPRETRTETASPASAPERKDPPRAMSAPPAKDVAKEIVKEVAKEPALRPRAPEPKVPASSLIPLPGTSMPPPSPPAVVASIEPPATTPKLDLGTRKAGDAWARGRELEATDPVEAVKAYRQGAEEGDPRAQTSLGFAYQNGRGVATDYAAARKWYEAAAAQGNAAAQNNLGNLYDAGLGVGKNEIAAVDWYRKSADQGYAIAQNNLALKLEKGHGIYRDYATAAELFRRAAESGNMNAMYNLGRLYESGSGVAKSRADALRWFQAASEKGHRLATAKLAELERR